MTRRSDRGRKRWRGITLASFLLLQSVAALFFVGDVLSDLRMMPFGPHTAVEALVAVALVAGIALSIRNLRTMETRLRDQARTIEIARGELSRVVADQFRDWSLTPAEEDIGLLALKGLDVAEIAEIRGRAPGTVRAQLAHIYAKADVSGRAQFAAWFVEDLLGQGTEPRVRLPATDEPDRSGPV